MFVEDSLTVSDKERFYITCAEIVGVKIPDFKNTMNIRRWSREYGNGRFQGYGLIRYYSPSLIQISLRNPTFSKICKNQEEVFTELKNLKETFSRIREQDVSALKEHLKNNNGRL